MSQLDDAVARYNKLLETGPCSELAWSEALHERMESARLSAGGRLICPFLRPNFITRRQYESLVKTGESLISAIDPGYQAREVAARLDTHLVNGHLHFVQYNADSPTGAGYADALAELFWELASPALLARLDLLPAEKMLAAIDPAYQALEVAARLDSHLVNGHLHFVQYNADSPTGAGYADAQVPVD